VNVLELGVAVGVRGALRRLVVALEAVAISSSNSPTFVWLIG